jgi:hypothetical protein
MTAPTTPDRIRKACLQLAAYYPDLFEATGRDRGHGAREYARLGRRDEHPAPVRIEVWDLIRQINQIVLDLEQVCAAALGFTTVPKPDPKYQQTRAVPAALGFIGRVADQLDEAGYADEVLAVLAGDRQTEGLVGAARRLLGLTERTLRLDATCPEPNPQQQQEAQGALCGGVLLALPERGVILCRVCGRRWSELEWERLGQLVRADQHKAAA